MKLYVFMEECQSNSTLYDLVKSSNPIRVDDIRSYMHSIVAGINVLQNLGIAHRYLKLQHILFDYNNQPKLSGWSRAVFAYDLSSKSILQQNCERRVRRNYFLPPEAFLKPYDPLNADIWSLGILLVAMSTKRYPFNVRDDKTKFSTQWRDFIKKHEMNVFVRNLCNKIFILNPDRRIKCDKILEDPYFKISKIKLTPLSIKASSQMIDRESSRVGALSAVDLAIQERPDVDSAAEANENNYEETEETVEEVPEQFEDGGAVGYEEQFAQQEMLEESTNLDPNVCDQIDENV